MKSIKGNSVLILLLIVMLVFSGCTGQKTDDETKETNRIEVDTMYETTSEVIKETEPEKWGVQDEIIAVNNEYESQTCKINLPYLATIRKGMGKIAYQTDNTLILLLRQTDSDTIEVNTLEESFKAYEFKAISTLESYRGVEYKDFAFEVTSTEKTTINDYEMCKFKGVHTFLYNDNLLSMNFVTYATKLKGNEAYVFWMVIDETEDQSMKETIEEHAYQMAKSIKEE